MRAASQLPGWRGGGTDVDVVPDLHVNKKYDDDNDDDYGEVWEDLLRPPHGT